MSLLSLCRDWSQAISHMIACWWAHIGFMAAVNGTGWMIGGAGGRYENSWLARDTEAGRDELYSASMYFVLVTVSSTGFGDISATTKEEEFAAVCIILIGVFMLACVSCLHEARRGLNNMTSRTSGYPSSILRAHTSAEFSPYAWRSFLE